jgi:hypothetical protein
VNDGLFLVARVAADSLGETLEWLGSDEPPFQTMDPLDFLSSAEVVAIYDLYRTQYLRLDARLNIRTPEALLEYNRWVIVVDRSGSVLASSCFKTTHYGLKLGLIASVGDAGGKAAVRAILLFGLTVRGVYGEVSEGVERIVSGRVPEVPPAVVETVLGKAVVPHGDGRHYTREIANVGPKTKLLVGKPVLE